VEMVGAVPANVMIHRAGADQFVTGFAVVR
jgi:hypothetical protein